MMFSDSGLIIDDGESDIFDSELLIEGCCDIMEGESDESEKFCDDAGGIIEVESSSTIF